MGPTGRGSPSGSSAYDEAHRLADSQYPRELWDLGQADLDRITETFQSLSANVGAVLRLNPSVKHPFPGRSLVKRVGNADVRVELALMGLNQSVPDRPEEFRYVLSVFRTPRRGFLHGLLHRPRRDPTEWRVVGVYTPADVRDAGASLREAIEDTVRSEFHGSHGEEP